MAMKSRQPDDTSGLEGRSCRLLELIEFLLCARWLGRQAYSHPVGFSGCALHVLMGSGRVFRGCI